MPPTEKSRPIRPTIQAIAAMAGVSRTTVSLILGNRQELLARFRAETISRVRAAAESLGYRANLMALSLRSSHPTFFGLVLRGPGRSDAIGWYHQAFEGQFLAGALEASRALHLHPVLATQDSPEPEPALESVRGVLDGGVLGVVFRTPRPVLKGPIQRQIEQGLPVVIVFPEHPTECPSNAIDVDNVAAGRLAARLLAQNGRRRWALVHEESAWEAIRLRAEGFTSSAGELGAKVEALALPIGLTENLLREWLTSRLQASRPDGIYAASSLSGIATSLACHAAGLRIPADVCLVGCDAPLCMAPGLPSITSVDASWYNAGEMAVRKMSDLRQQGESVFESVRLPPIIHKGESCAVNDSPHDPAVGG